MLNIILFTLFLSFLGVTSFSITLKVDTLHSKTTEQDEIEEAIIDLENSNEYEDILMTNQMANRSKFSKRISEIKCMEYIDELLNRQYSTDDHSHDFSIINGIAVKAGQFPHMGALGWLNKDLERIHFLCGASLISENFMVTAAHCTYYNNSNYAKPKPVLVRLGTRYIEVPQTESQRDVSIKSITCHPEYKAPKKYYDIALVKLAERLTFSKFIQPACLAKEYNLNRKQLIATGWGTTKNGARQDQGCSRVLRSTEIDVFDNKRCEDLLLKFKNRNWKGMRPHEMCAGQLDGSTDTCQGDSGGPLQYLLLNTTQGSIHRIIAITSFGLTTCATKNAPGIYTKIPSMLDWIEKHVW